MNAIWTIDNTWICPYLPSLCEAFMSSHASTEGQMETGGCPEHRCAASSCSGRALYQEISWGVKGLRTQPVHLSLNTAPRSGAESLWSRGAIFWFAQGSHGDLTHQRRLISGQTPNQYYPNYPGERLSISRERGGKRMIILHLPSNISSGSALAPILYTLFKKKKILWLLGPPSIEGNSSVIRPWGIYLPFKSLAPLGFKFWFFHLLAAWPWAKSVTSQDLSPPPWNRDRNVRHFIKSKTLSFMTCAIISDIAKKIKLPIKLTCFRF